MATSNYMTNLPHSFRAKTNIKVTHHAYSRLAKCDANYNAATLRTVNVFVNTINIKITQM